MDVAEAVDTVLAVREFKDDPIPDAVVRKIVEAAHRTASASNKQPWHFIVVGDRETLRRMGELAKTGPYIAQAPLAIAVAIEDGAIAISDASRAIQSMVLAAWSEGVGSNWVGFGDRSPGMDAIAELLEIPSQLELLAVVPFGYPARKIGRGRKNRKPLAEVFSSERFGSPFAESGR